MLSPAVDRPADGRRRVAVVAGTRTYGQGLAELAFVPDEIALVRSAVTDLGMELSDRAGLDPEVSELQRAVQHAMRPEQDGGAPYAVVFYYTAHGFGGDATFRVAAKGGIRGDAATSISAEEIAYLVSQPGPDEVVVILDACESGGAVDAFSVLRAKIEGLRLGGPDVYLVTSTTRIDDAKQLAFAEALAAALRTPGLSANRRFISPADLRQEINYRLRHTDQRVSLHSPPAPALPFSRVFPNPRYDRSKPTSLPEAADGTGWAFCGRRRAVTDIVRHLDAPRPDTPRLDPSRPDVPGLDLPDPDPPHPDTPPIDGWPDPLLPLMVTGPPGSGKSTLLAWIAAASSGAPLPSADPAAPARVPPGCVDCLVDARGVRPAQVLEAVASGLRLADPDTGRFWQELEAREEPTRILVDSVDWADDPADVEELVKKVLAPLARLPRVRLVLGGAEPLTTLAARHLPLDAPDYFDPADLERLAAGVLTGRTGSLRRAVPAGEIRKTAARIRQRAGHSFLRAYYFSLDLAGRAPEEDEADVHSSVADIFEEQLAGLDREDPRWAEDLMAPLALAMGAGMPSFPLWIEVVRRLSGREVDYPGLSRLLEAGRDFVTDHLSGGDSAGWRLRAEELASFLLRRQDTAAAHAAFTEALEAALASADEADEAPQWSNADSYTRLNFAEHAVRAGVLARYLADPDFLLAMDPARLRRALTLANASEAGAVRDVLDQAAGRERDDADRMSRLSFLAAAHGRGELAARASARTRAWHTSWVDRTPADAVTAVPARDGDGVHLVVATEAGRVLAAAPGHRALRPLADGEDPVSTMAAGLMAGRPVAVTGTWGGKVWLYELGSGASYELCAFNRRVVGCAVCERHVLVATSLGWTRIGDPLGPRAAQKAGFGLSWIATGTAGGRGLVVGCGTYEVAVWSEDGTLEHTFPSPHTKALTRVALYEGGVITAGDDGLVHRCDLDGGNTEVLVRHGDLPVTSVRVLVGAAGSRLLTTGQDGRVVSCALGAGLPPDPVTLADVGLPVLAADVEADGRLVLSTTMGTARVDL